MVLFQKIKIIKRKTNKNFIWTVFGNFIQKLYLICLRNLTLILSSRQIIIFPIYYVQNAKSLSHKKPFVKCFREHLSKNNIEKIKSNYSPHLVVNTYNYTQFNTNLKSLHIYKKGRLVNTLEEFEIYRAFKINNDKGNTLNDQLNC